MKKTERIISSILLVIILFSNISTPFAYAAESGDIHLKLPQPQIQSASLASASSLPQPGSGSVLGTSTSLLGVGTESYTIQNSAFRRTPIIMQALAKKVYQIGEAVTVAVTNPDNEALQTTVLNNQGKSVATPISESNDGTTTNVQIDGSNEIVPGEYTVRVTDQSGDVTSQDFQWGVLALNTDKTMYHPGETADISMAVLDDKGNMVCDASLELQITNQATGITNNLSMGAASSATETDSASPSATKNTSTISVNPQCQKHDFSLQPDYEAHYTFVNSGTYNMTLTATTQAGKHTITDTVPVTNQIPFDVQRISATRTYPPDTYPMTLNITAHQDFNGTVTETVPQDFTITPATGSAQTNSYTNMQTMYLNGTNPTQQLAQAVLGTGTSSLVMPFQGNYPITQGFGAELTDPTLQAFYTQYGLAGHDGVDFGVPMDTPLYAVDDGNIIWSGPGDYGITIIIQHSWGESYYGHLSNTAVKVGDHVTKGQLIGYSGESGEATGPHLHFGMKPNNPDMKNGYYGKVDPLPYLPYNNQQPQDISGLGPSLPLPTGTVTPTLAPVDVNVLGSSTSAQTISTPSPVATGAATLTPAASPSATPSPVTPTPTPATTQTVTQNVNSNFSVLDKEIETNEQLANNSQTEKVKVISWKVTLKKGESTTLGYDFQGPQVSPEFYLLGPLQFYQSGSNRVVFQEQRQWEIASDDVGVDWYVDSTGRQFNGYSWQYRKKIDINHNQVDSAQGVPTLDSSPAPKQGNGGTAAASTSWSQTVTTSQSNLILILGVALDGGQTVNTGTPPTWNGTQTFTKLDSQLYHVGGDHGTEDDEFWYLVNPASGTHTVSVTFTGSADFVANSASFYNVNQTTPLGTDAKTSGTGTPGTTNAGLTTANGHPVPSGSNQLVVDVLGGRTANSDFTPSGTNPTQTALWNGATNWPQGTASERASAGSTTDMPWTESASDDWADIGVALQPVTLTSLVTPTLDANTHQDNGAGTNSSMTITSFTVSSSHSNEILILGVGLAAGGTVSTGGSAPTWGAQTFTKLSSSLFNSNNNDDELWYLVNPQQGNQTLTVHFTGAESYVVGLSDFYNVNQTSPLGSVATNSGSGTNFSLAVPSGSSQLPIDILSTSCGFAVNPGSSQTQLYADGPSSACGLSSYAQSAGSTTTLTWTDVGSDTWYDIGVALQPVTSSSSAPTVTFMDSGGDATQGTQFWTQHAGCTASTTVAETGSYSLACDSGAWSGINSVLNTSGGRVSFYVYLSFYPTTDEPIMEDTVNSNGTEETGVVLRHTDHKLGIAGGGGGVGDTVLQLNTWYRIDLSYNVTSTTVNSINIYLNGNLQIMQTNATLPTASGQELEIGRESGTGGAGLFYFDDIYVDSGTDLSDPGDIHVTAKLPYANGAAANFATQIGTGNSSYGTGHAPEVNERPLATADGWKQASAANNVTEEYAIEPAGVGDVNISSHTLIADEAWVDASISAACTGGDNGKIINNGTSTTIALSTTATIFTNIANNSSYPLGSTDVGITSCSAGTLRTVSLFEAGVMIAYTNRPSSKVTFMDSGGDATQDTTSELAFWGGATTGSVAVDNTTSETGPDSLKITSGGTGSTAYVSTNNGYIPGDTGTRISFYVNFASLPTGNLLFFNDINVNNDVFELWLTPGGILQLDTNGTQIGSNGATLSPNTWYRIDVSYAITSTTNYKVNVYVNGSQSISGSNSPTLVGTGTAWLYLGWGTASVGNNKIMRIDDVYIDNGNDLSDTGDIHVTAKRPYSNGTENSFPTQIGSGGSSYGSGHALQENERPISTTNGWQSSSSSLNTPTLDNSAELDEVSFQSTWTTSSFTVNSGHQDYYLVVALVDHGFPPTIPNISYGGEAMSFIGQGTVGTNTNDMFLFGLKSPPTGSNTFTVTPGPGGTSFYTMVADSYYNVNQTTPYGSMQNSHSDNVHTTNPSLSFTGSAIGRVVTDFVWVDATTPNPTPNAGQTQASDTYYSPYGANIGSSYTSPPLTGTTYTMGWGNNPVVWWGLSAIDLIGSPQQENYTIESASQGDVNISSYYPIADEAWVDAEWASGTTACSTPQIINNGTTAAINVNSSAAYSIFTSIDTNYSYPSGNTDVGMIGCQDLSGTHSVNLAEAGMQIAYTTYDPNSLINFPVLINLASDANVAAHAQNPSGNDILFTDSTGRNLLNFQIEDYNASTGSLQAWVNIPALSPLTDTIIYMYYGNPAAASKASTAVWNGNYAAVYHLAPTVTGCTSSCTVSVADSTSNNELATNTGNHVTETASGQIDGAGNFNGSTSSVITLPTTGSLANVTQNITASLWVNITTNQTYNELLASHWSINTPGTNGWNLYADSGDLLWGVSVGASPAATQFNAIYSSALSTGTWYYVVGTYDGSNVNLYLNGTLVNTVAASGVTFTTPPNTSISIAGSGLSLRGAMDEVRIANTPFSAGWIATEYNNQSAPTGSFYTLGNEETKIYAPTLAALMRHGQFFNTQGNIQPFTF